ncbi:MAG: alpha/beta fold hydrolase [Solirubrobacteraceae bacterium]
MSGQPETIRVQANGINFAALAWGQAEAPLALMVHGYPDTAWTWRHLGPYLAQRGWRAVAPFTRGYAPTELAPSDSYLISDLRDDVLALHTALGGDGRAALIGHDWGAITTWSLTEREPARFARYVCIAVPPPPALLRPWTSPSTLGDAARQARMSWYFFYNQLPGYSERGLDRVIPKLWRDWSPGYDATEDLAHVFESLNPPGHRRAALRYYRNNLQKGLVKTFTVKGGAPALSLHGETDGCMNPAIVVANTDLLPAGSRFELVRGVGHFMQLEDPARINDLIGEWIGAPGV